MPEHQAVLLDTSVLVEPPSNLDSIAERVAVSTLSIAELASGLGSTNDPVEHARRYERFERILNVYSPLPYSASAARLYGALCDAVRAAGRNPRPRRFDLLLASVAGDLDIPILTRNPDGFRGIHPIVQVVECPIPTR